MWNLIGSACARKRTLAIRRAGRLPSGPDDRLDPALRGGMPVLRRGLSHAIATIRSGSIWDVVFCPACVKPVPGAITPRPIWLAATGKTPEITDATRPGSPRSTADAASEGRSGCGRSAREGRRERGISAPAGQRDLRSVPLRVQFVASPRHADGMVVTGPVSRNMGGASPDGGDSRRSSSSRWEPGRSRGFPGSPEVLAAFEDIPVTSMFGHPPHPLTCWTA
jgi:hypothetical protein